MSTDAPTPAPPTDRVRPWDLAVSAFDALRLWRLGVRCACATQADTAWRFDIAPGQPVQIECGACEEYAMAVTAAPIAETST